jgi:GntR family transcriptional repressor for pyruvate dehydrogenase complex
MLQSTFSHSILQYIVNKEQECGEEGTKLPPLGDLAKKLGVSRGKLREELIAAQVYGLVDMRPGDGTYVQPFDFYAAIRPLVLYSIALDRTNFDYYYRLRASLEAAFWEDAVRNLGQEEFEGLERILQRAERKLWGKRVEIPHTDHRDFHVFIFSKLENSFVQGLLKAYWDAYEAVGLHRYFEYSYYERMWSWHRDMVEAIATGAYGKSKEILIRHFTLLEDRLQEENN